MDTQELENKLKALKEARDTAADARETKRLIIEIAQATPEYIQADTVTNQAEAQITELETSIREMTLALYRRNVQLPAQVTVKNFKAVTIHDETKAFEWCLTHFTPALKLDPKTFEKAAKDGKIPSDLATVSHDPRAQIATKLEF